MRKKSYGQHFLINPSVSRKIVEAADIQSDDVVVEVGPGGGALTDHLPKNALFLVELDRDLLASLEASYPSAHIVHADAATVNYPTFLPAMTPWILIGNLPYNAGTAIVMHALLLERPPRRMVVMLQKEVGDRMLAQPGSMSLLSVATQLYTTPSRVLNVKPGNFSPAPKVDSVVVRLDRRPDVHPQAEKIIALAKTAFSTPRKQLHGTLKEKGGIPSEKTKEILRSLGLPETARPQELSVENWVQLWNTTSLNLS